MSYGMRGFLGWGKETTWGTAVAVDTYVEMMNESIQAVPDRFDYKNAINAMYEPDRASGLLRVRGGVQAAAWPDWLAAMAVGAMGTKSGATVLSGFLYRTGFTNPAAAADFADGVPSQPYTLEVFRDITSSHRISGAVVNRLQLSVAPNGALMVAPDFIAKDRAYLAKTSPTFPGSPVEPFMFNTVSVSIGGSANTRVENLIVTIDNQLEGIPALNASSTIARMRRRGPQIIRIQGTMDFIDLTEENDFINQTERAFRATLFKGQSFEFVIDAPKMVYATAVSNVRGRERNLINFEAEARYLTSSTTALGLYVTSTKSTY